MHEIWADLTAHGVDLGLVAAIIVGAVLAMSGFNTINSEIMEQQAISEELQMYREYNQYDFKHVYPQDVISAIFRYRGEPVVRVRSSKGDYSWTEVNNPAGGYNTTDIANLIDQTVVYDASVVFDANGVPTAYEFVACPGNCGR